MPRLLEALAVLAGAAVLTLLIALIGSINLFGSAVVGMLMFLAALASALLSIWLNAHGHTEYGRFFKRASVVLLIGVLVQHKLPNLAPGTAARAKAWFTGFDRDNQRAALTRLAPQPVSCGDTLVVAGKTVYWWHPSDDPLVCYDSVGKHPKGHGELLPVDDAVAQIIERQRQRPKPPAQSPAVAQAPAPTPPPPEAIPGSSSREPSPGTEARWAGDWVPIPKTEK